MKKLKEVTVFTDGDSSKISTWSNVPFFFTETLLAKGIKVNRVDISLPGKGRVFFNQVVYRLMNIFNKDTSYDYSRSLMRFDYTRKLIKEAIQKFPNSEADIFLTFSFSSAGLANKPIVQFGDWSYKYYFEHLVQRLPDFFERTSIAREHEQIMGSDIVLSLFPGSADYINRSLGIQKVSYLGNVINSLYEVPREGISVKKASNNLLFAGSIKYLEGAKSLVKAFISLQKLYPDLLLHIIGIGPNEFDDLPAGVICYGYLDKGNDADRALYYKLFKEAKVFVNTTPKWGGFSASIEAMYFFTPVIVTPYGEFVKTFGEEINFGFYCQENSQALIEENILNVLQHSSYEQLCTNAHEAVQGFTWSALIDKVINKIEEFSSAHQ